MTVDERERRLRTFESNGGRDLGWYVEKDGRTWAMLTDCTFADMFWDTYAVQPLVQEPALREQLFSKDFWHLGPLPTFRNRVTDETLEALPGGLVPTEANPRLMVHGLYSKLTPSPYEQLLLLLLLRRVRRPRVA